MSLVEVFVALLVLSVGLIALAKLQVDLVRGGGESRARTSALALAEEKIEDLRTFSLKNAAVGATWPVAVSQPLAWSFIANDAGGRISGGAVTRAGVQYNLTWTSSLQSTDGATATGGYQSFYKVVNVNVGWTGADGVAQTVSLAASIPDTPPGLTKLASALFGNPEGPVLEYDNYDAPQVISVPIDLGRSRHRETSKPLPDVLAQGDYAHQVTFDVVNYHHLPDDRFAVDRRESFVTVNCRCTLEASGPGRGPATFVLTGSLLRDKPGTVLSSKPHTGTVRTSGSRSVSSQPELCSVCCRDHHDAGAQYRYNPTDTDDHAHYFWNESAGGYEGPVSVGQAYDEACRMKRVNGIFQVFEDWNLVAINAIPEVDLSGDVSAYRDYVASVVRNYVTGGSLPTAPTFSSVTVTPGGAAQLQGRAIYIDYMSAEEKAAAAALITADDNVSFLESVPWYEINLTKLAQWKLQDTNSTNDYLTAPVTGETCRNATQVDLAGKVACISSEAVRTEELQQDNYNRGLAKGGPETGAKDAQVYLLNGNTGLIDTRAVTEAASLAAPIFDEQLVSNDAGSAVQGSISKLGKNNPSGNPWSGPGAVTCSYTAGGSPQSCGAWISGSGNDDPRVFRFNAPTGTAVVVTVSFPGGVVCPSSRSVTAPDSGLTFTLKSTGSTCP
jgi:type II secretory pathway pseudopilin PulG